MLGRSILHHLSTTTIMECNCVGTGYSRVSPTSSLLSVDLLSPNAIPQLITKVNPDFVIHCAAERRPDCADKDPQRTVQLNVKVTQELARECYKKGAVFVYISTDYVFDGGITTNVYPPYKINDPTSPVNLYGQTKLDGENAILSLAAEYNLGAGKSPIIVRVPVLYATDCQTLDESASLVVAKALLNDNDVKDDSQKKEKKKKVDIDHWGVRFPTLVDDVAKCLPLILNHALKQQETNSSSVEKGRIFHISSPERCTKYELVQLMGEIMKVDSSHIIPNTQPPKGAKRPQNTQLNCAETWEYLGLADPMEFTSLREGMAKALAPFSSMFV